MTALVTGAGGFLGRTVVERLLAAGEKVRVLVRTPEQAGELGHLGAEAVQGDVRDAAAVAKATARVNTVYHCATAHGAHASREEILAVNVGGTRNVLDALKQAGAGRMVFVSGINVLGTRNFVGSTEDWPLRPESDVLAQAKIEGERVVTDYHARLGVDTVIVRLPLIYGPRDRRNIPKLMRAIERGKFAYIGSTENVIPIIHVEDAAEGLRLAGTSPAALGRIYHLADGVNTTIRELAGYLAELMGLPAPKKKLPYAVPWFACTLFGALRSLGLIKGAGPIDRISLRFLGTSRPVDISRARRELGFQPAHEFRSAMAETFRWFKEHADG